MAGLVLAVRDLKDQRRRQKQQARERQYLQSQDTQEDNPSQVNVQIHEPRSGRNLLARWWSNLKWRNNQHPILLGNSRESAREKQEREKINHGDFQSVVPHKMETSSSLQNDNGSRVVMERQAFSRRQNLQRLQENQGPATASTDCKACNLRATLLSKFPAPFDHTPSNLPLIPMLNYEKILVKWVKNHEQGPLIVQEDTPQHNKLARHFMRYLQYALHALMEKRMKEINILKKSGQGFKEPDSTLPSPLEDEVQDRWSRFIGSPEDKAGVPFEDALRDTDRAEVLDILKKQAVYDLNGFSGALTWKYADKQHAKEFLTKKIKDLKNFLP